MSKNNFVFVITAKNDSLYPQEKDIAPPSGEEKSSTDGKWTKIEMVEGVKTSLNNIQSNLYFKNAENFDWRFLHKPFDSKNGIFDVYVVPCLIEKSIDDIDFNEIKTKYLEKVVTQIRELHSTLFPTCFYLIAHEKDFNADKPDVLATSLPANTSDNFFLKDLLEIKHVYLFQHEDSCKVYEYLSELINKGDINACKDILYIIENEARMISFFQEVDNENEYNYSKTKQ